MQIEDIKLTKICPSKKLKIFNYVSGLGTILKVVICGLIFLLYCNGYVVELDITVACMTLAFLLPLLVNKHTIHDDNNT
jgi:hypothetical protein